MALLYLFSTTSVQIKDVKRSINLSTILGNLTDLLIDLYDSNTFYITIQCMERYNVTYRDSGSSGKHLLKINYMIFSFKTDVLKMLQLTIKRVLHHVFH